MNKKSVKCILKVILYFILYLAFAYITMLPGYLSAEYWLLFPIAAAFLMAGPMTRMMNMIKKPGSAAILPLLFYLLAKFSGELNFTVCWGPFLAAVLIAEFIHIAIGPDKNLSIRISVPVSLLSMAMWNNGFYFGGQAYREATIADMGEAYAESAFNMSKPVTYIAVLAGVVLAAYLSERLTEKLFIKKADVSSVG